MNTFAKIVLSSKGEQVLYYVTPEGGDYILHQVYNDAEGVQIDICVSFCSSDEDVNKEKVYAMFNLVTTVNADNLIDIVTKLIAGDDVPGVNAPVTVEIVPEVTPEATPKVLQ